MTRTDARVRRDQQHRSPGIAVAVDDSVDGYLGSCDLDNVVRALTGHASWSAPRSSLRWMRQRALTPDSGVSATAY